MAAYGPRGAVVAGLKGRTKLPEGVRLRDGQGRVAGAGWWDGGDDITFLGRPPPILTRFGWYVLQYKTCLGYSRVPASATNAVH